MKIGMIENTFESEKSLQEKIKELGLKEEIEPFDIFSHGATAESKLESDPTFGKELEKKDFDLDGKKVDIYRIKKDNEPLREIYIHTKG